MPTTVRRVKFSRKASDLEEAIEERYYIACSETGCHNEETVDGSDYESHVELFKLGWRMNDIWPICPECVKAIKNSLKK